MKYYLNPSNIFMQEVNILSEKTKKQLAKKLILVKENPFHNKALTGFKVKLFRIRFNDNGIEKRAIYSLINEEIFLIAILKRKHNYRELKSILEKLSLI
ncbi:MAG: hypothetical protein PHP82_00480 [Candidatus ainarchaeum sp.]|nr:hypothetical protein [Candidatus ainarchaeum sp.]